MHTATLVLAWWFLAKPITFSFGNSFASSQCVPALPPSAYGPYPTADSCRLAEHDAAPSDRRFWDTAELTKWQPYDAQHARYEAGAKAYKDRMNVLAKENPHPGLYKLPDGTLFTIYRWNIYCSVRPHPDFFADSDSLRKKLIPLEPPQPEDLASDTYIILRPCSPIKGWYTTMEPR